MLGLARPPVQGEHPRWNNVSQTDPHQSAQKRAMAVSAPFAHKLITGEYVMVLDNEALIALGFLVSILVVTAGLTFFLVRKIKR